MLNMSSETKKSVPLLTRYDVPIHDLRHARLSLLKINIYGTPEQQREGRARIYKRYPELVPCKRCGHPRERHSGDKHLGHCQLVYSQMNTPCTCQHFYKREH